MYDGKWPGEGGEGGGWAGMRQYRFVAAVAMVFQREVTQV